MEALFLFESSITTRPATQGHNPGYANYFERLIFCYRLEIAVSWTYETYLYIGNETCLILPKVLRSRNDIKRLSISVINQLDAQKFVLQ